MFRGKQDGLRYHKKFSRFHPKTIRLFKELRLNWSNCDDTQKWMHMQRFVMGASEVYGMEFPRVKISSFAGDGYYSILDNKIFMSKPSIITVVHEFRHAMQVQQKARGWSGREIDVEHDARGWSLSLYYKVAPITFRRLVRSGKVFHIEPSDLLRSVA